MHIEVEWIIKKKTNVEMGTWFYPSVIDLIVRCGCCTPDRRM